MRSFLLCSVAGGGRCLGGDLEVLHVRGAGDRGALESELGRLVAEALRSRAMRRAEEESDISALFLKVPDVDDGRIQQNDVKGIIGEIVAEVVLEGCGFGKPFYSKWRHTGTSLSGGIDIIMIKGDAITICESKHLHTPRAEGDASPDASAAIVAAFRQSSYRRVRKSLVQLRRRFASNARLGGGSMRAARPAADAMLRAARIIDTALSSGQGLPTNAVVAIDARHAVDAESIMRRLGPDTLQGVGGPAAAVVASVDGLQEATILLIGRHC